MGIIGIQKNIAHNFAQTEQTDYDKHCARADLLNKYMF